MKQISKYPLYFDRLPHIYNQYEELTIALVLELLADAYEEDSKLERYLYNLSEETFKDLVKRLKKMAKDGKINLNEKIKLYNHPDVYRTLKQIENEEWRRFTEYSWIAYNVITESMTHSYKKTFTQLNEIYHFTPSGNDIPKVQITDTYITQEVLPIPWCSDGKTYSQRIYANVANFEDKLSFVLEQGIEKGKGLDWMIQAWRKLTGSMAYETTRLLKTETMAMWSIATKDRFLSEGIEYVEIVGDAECGGICLDYVDGEPIRLRDADIGIELPPYHPNCACSYIAYTEEEELEDESLDE